jgi:glutathione S-transferase
MTRSLLYSGTKNASSWAMRAWLALREAGVDFEEIVVDIRRPQRIANLAWIGCISPPASVPVLVTDGQLIFDSLAIMEYANEACGNKLLPGKLLDRAAARSVLAWQHAGLSGIARRISFESAFYPDRRPLTGSEVAECARLQNHLESLLAASGGPYLFGAVSLPDLALVPTVIRLTRHDLDFSRWKRVGVWCEALLDLASVQEWMAEASTLPPVRLPDYYPESRARPDQVEGS